MVIWHGVDADACVLVLAVVPTVLLDEIEAAEAEGNDDRIEGVLCGAVKQLKMNRAKPDTTLYLSLMYLAKIKPNIFATEGVIEVSTRKVTNRSFLPNYEQSCTFSQACV